MPVNDKKTDSIPSTRSLVMAQLRSVSGALSGEVLAAAAGVSRVAVWKAVRSLQENGYTISVSPAGYKLEEDTGDSIFPWDFGSAEKRFLYWESTDSTMNRAQDAALSGAADGTIITANSQSAGRGTSDRIWETAEGALCFTLITRPNLLPSERDRSVLAAQCALVLAAREITGKPVYTHWPNDLLICDKTAGGLSFAKVGGVLCEALTSGYTTNYLNLGIGLNTGAVPQNLSSDSAANLPGGALPKTSKLRKRLLEGFLAAYPLQLASADNLSRLWNSLCPDYGTRVTGQTLAGLTLPGLTTTERGTPTVHHGTFLGVDGRGNALLRSDTNDSILTFPPGSFQITTKGCPR